MVQVAICGGGLAGATLALCLQKHGISCVIYERATKEFAAGGNIALSPNALRVLDHVGVYDQVRNIGYAFETVAFTNGQGVELARVYNGSYKIYNFPALRIQRSQLREALVQQCRRVGIEIYYEKKCVGVTSEDDTSATIEFEDGETVTADYIVGCDGIHSKIRPFVRPHARPEFQGLTGISGTFKMSDLADVDLKGLHLPCFLFGATGSFAIMPATNAGEGISYFATFEVPEKSKEEWAAFDADKENLSELLKERFLTSSSRWPEVVKALCERAPPESLTNWPFYQVPPGTNWTSPLKRVFLIGDAAHAMPPSGGQGGATSLEDAETLGYLFSRVFDQSFDRELREQTIRGWEKHRITRLQKIQDFNTKNGNLRKTSPSALQQAIKEWVIWALLKWMGPTMNSQWIYGYNAESVLAELW